MGGKQWIHLGDPVDMVEIPTEEGGVSGARQRPISPSEKGGQISPSEKGGQRQHKIVATDWCMFDSP